MLNEAWHLAVKVAVPITEKEIDDFSHLGYVGRLSNPAVFTKFFAHDFATACDLAFSEAKSILDGEVNILAVKATREKFWDWQQMVEANHD